MILHLQVNVDELEIIILEKLRLVAVSYFGCCAIEYLFLVYNIVFSTLWSNIYIEGFGI